MIVRIVLVTVLVAGGIANAEVLARYRGNFAVESPAAGWQYLWNARGDIGAAANYEPMKWSAESNVYSPAGGKLPTVNPGGWVSLRANGGHAGRGSKQVADQREYYAIAAYTIPAGKKGIAWVSDGQVLRDRRGASADETINLRVYLGDQLKHEATGRGGELTAFTVQLGQVNGGETIYIAIGPDGNDLSDGFEMDFRIVVLPAGEKPVPSGFVLKEDPTQPAIRRNTIGDPDPKFTAAHEAMLAKAQANKNAQLVFLGDSITAGWGKAPEVWRKVLGPHKPLNLGVGGNQTQNLLWRIENGELEGLKPKTVVVLIGTNNIGRNSAAEMAAGVEAVVKAVRHKLPEAKVIVTAIFPRSEKPTEPSREKIKQANALIAKLDDGKRVRVIDIGHQLVQPDGTISKELMPDFLHPNEPAYRSWAEAIVPLLQD